MVIHSKCHLVIYHFLATSRLDFLPYFCLFSPAFLLALFFSRISPPAVPGYRLVSKRINGPFLLFSISGYAVFPGEIGRRCGGASFLLSEPVRPLSWVKPLGIVALLLRVIWHLLSHFLLLFLNTSIGVQKIQLYKSLMTRILLWLTKCVSVLKYARNRSKEVHKPC